MKKLHIIVLMVVLCSFATQMYAQGKGGEGKGGKKADKEAFFAKRNTYITEKVGLTAEEASVFMPLDNELLQKKFEVGRECHKLERSLRNKTDKTDAECKALLKCREEMKEKQDALDKEYLEKFKKVLSSEKIVKYQNADRDFFNEFMHNRKKDNQQ